MGQIKNIKLHIVTDIKKNMALRLLASSASKVIRHTHLSTGFATSNKLVMRTLFASTTTTQRSMSTTTQQSVMVVPHDLDGLVGQAKAEIEAFHEGHADPWDWDPVAHGYGTRRNPILVPTLLDERVVGCLCEGIDGSDANFMLLTWDDPIQRCADCGNTYKLVEGPVYDKVPPYDGEDHYDEEHH